MATKVCALQIRPAVKKAERPRSPTSESQTSISKGGGCGSTAAPRPRPVEAIRPSGGSSNSPGGWETLKGRTEHDPRLVYRGTGSGESRQAASCVAITETLERAGLAREPDVRPLSIVAWAGRRIFTETGRIDEVAKRTGVRSLDGAARLIGWEWMDEQDSEGSSS